MGRFDDGIMRMESRPGWYPGEMVRIIGYQPGGEPIVVMRPLEYRLDTFYPDGEHGFSL